MDHSKQAAGIFNKLADLYQSKFMDVSAYAVQLDQFLDQLNKPDATILEIGCGPGNVINYLLQKNDKLQIHGIDLAPNMIELAKKNCPAASFQVLDCREVSSISGKFDGIICSFCLPYLNIDESARLINDISALLKPDGMLYLSAIEGEYENSGPRKGSTGDEIFMHYYPALTLTEMLDYDGFINITVDSVENKSNPVGDTDLVFIARKKNTL